MDKFWKGMSRMATGCIIGGLTLVLLGEETFMIVMYGFVFSIMCYVDDN